MTCSDWKGGRQQHGTQTQAEMFKAAEGPGDLLAGTWQLSNCCRQAMCNTPQRPDGQPSGLSGPSYQTSHTQKEAHTKVGARSTRGKKQSFTILVEKSLLATGRLNYHNKILTNNKPNINKYKRPITHEDCILTSGLPPRLRNRNPPSVLINTDCKNQTGNQTQVRRVSIACCDLLLP